MSHKLNLLVSVLAGILICVTVAVSNSFRYGYVYDGMIFDLFGAILFLFVVFFIFFEWIRTIRKRSLIGLSLLMSVVINFGIVFLFPFDCDGCFVIPIAGFPFPMYSSDYGPENNTGLYLPFILNLIFWTTVVYLISALIAFIVKKLRVQNR